MKKELIFKLAEYFEKNRCIEQDVEFWMARDLQILFEYSTWENFLNVIEKAKIACNNSKVLIINHFREVTKMVDLGSGSQREIQDLRNYLRLFMNMVWMTMDLDAFAAKEIKLFLEEFQLAQ